MLVNHRYIYIHEDGDIPMLVAFHLQLGHNAKRGHIKGAPSIYITAVQLRSEHRARGIYCYRLARRMRKRTVHVYRAVQYQQDKVYHHHPILAFSRVILIEDYVGMCPQLGTLLLSPGSSKHLITYVSWVFAQAEPHVFQIHH